MSLKLKIYIGTVVILATVLFIYLIPSLPAFSDIWLPFIFFLVLSVFSEFFPVNLPMGGVMSIGFPVDYALILVYGPALSMIVTILSALIAEIIERKSSWFKILFNISQLALSAGIAGLVYQNTGGIVGFHNFLKFIFPATLCALTYCFVNLIMVTVVMSLAQGSRIFTVWRVNFKENLATYLAEAPLGFLMTIIYVQVGIFGILLFFFPLLLARRSFELYTKMRKMYLETIRALAAAIDAKDPYTKGHSERVAQMAVSLARELNLPEGEIENLEYSALLHDIGKIGIDEKILRKDDGLTNEEYDKIKKHTITGAKIIEPVDFLKKSYQAIYHHHERFNGNGYPDGIKEEDIPLAARIISVADAYDAMNSNRPYRKKLSRDKIIKEL
ncbi:MAG TPA: HD-GYP domain-containing protein, partial [Candidatus Atribacteria bacterium]|nr:HD-GYP domain-containing protein [Candidatus Atribacteria bacterium]